MFPISPVTGPIVTFTESPTLGLVIGSYSVISVVKVTEFGKFVSVGFLVVLGLYSILLG